MTEYTSSLVLIIPDSHKAEANRLMCALDQDVLPGNTFSVPLSADGTLPATHWGARGVMLPSFSDMMEAAKASGNPPGRAYADFDLTIGQVKQVFDNLVISDSPQGDMTGLEHFNAALAAAGLVRIVETI
jgi:hypothetical protein